MHYSLLFASLALLSGLSSCRFIEGQRVYGNGHVTTQDRNVGSFNSIRTGGAMNVHIALNTTPTIKIQADDNLMQYIDVYTEGTTLVVRTKDGYSLNPSKEVIVYASAPVFKDIDVSGSGDIISDGSISGSDPLSMHVSGSGNIQVNVEVPKVSTEISGSGDVELKGKAQDFSAIVSGSGKVKCFELSTDNVSLDLSGASDAEVNADKKLNISVSGSGSVRYKGNAAVSQHISGSGDVSKVN